MTPLRQKLIDEIQLRGFSPNTQDSYVRSVAGLAGFYHRSPDKISDEEIKAYLLHLLRVRKLAVSSIIVAVGALRFFFGQILHRPTEAIQKALPTMKKPILRPRVYSVRELEKLFGASDMSPKHRALLMTTYAAGLRVSEVCHLRIPDLLSDRFQIRVAQGKNHKDRYTLFSPRLQEQLRTYWRLYRPKDWVFPSKVYPDRPLPRMVRNTRSTQRWSGWDCPTVAEYIVCGIRSQRICWKPVLIHLRCSGCSATAGSRPQRPTSMFVKSAWLMSAALSIRLILAAPGRARNRLSVRSYDRLLGGRPGEVHHVGRGRAHRTA